MRADLVIEAEGVRWGESPDPGAPHVRVLYSNLSSRKSTQTYSTMIGFFPYGSG